MLEVCPLGRCYEQAGRYVREHDWTLVHGVVRTKEGNFIKHAWAKKGDQVWNPTDDKIYSLSEWERIVVEVEAEYTPEESMIMMARAHHWGPWTWEERKQILGRD